MTRWWSDKETDILSSNCQHGVSGMHQAIIGAGYNRTRTAVARKANLMKLDIFNSGRYQTTIGKSRAPGGKWRKRVNGKVITLGREGLTDDQVVLCDGHVVKRAEMMRLVKLGYYNTNDLKIKPLMRTTVAVDQRVSEILGAIT